MDDTQINVVFSELRDMRDKLSAVKESAVEIRNTKEAITQMHTDLRELKTMVNSDMRLINSTFDAKVQSLETRLQLLEREKPVTDLMKKWVIGAITLVVVAVMSAIVAIAIPTINNVRHPPDVAAPR